MALASLRKQIDDRWMLLLLAVACLIVGYGFVTFGFVVLEGEMSKTDRAIRAWMLAHRATPLVELAKAVTFLGTKPLLVVFGALVGWRVSRGSKLFVVLVPLCAIGAAEFVDVIKLEFGVARPLRGMLDRQSFSFPSGHVSGTAAIATLLGYAALRKRVAPRLVVSVSTLVVLMMALSRVYLDVHWTSDVVGGGLIGVALGLACCAVWEWSDRRAARRPATIETRAG